MNSGNLNPDDPQPEPLTWFARWGGFRRIFFAIGLAFALGGMCWWRVAILGMIGGLLVGLTIPLRWR